MEHVYEPDVDAVLSEMYRVTKKYAFLLVATIQNNEGIILERGKPVPEQWEGCCVAGHVIIKEKKWWMENKFSKFNWVERKDLLLDFCDLVEEEVLSNWMQNTMLIMEKK